MVFEKVGMQSPFLVEHFSPGEAKSTFGATGLGEAAEVVVAEGTGDFGLEGGPVGAVEAGGGPGGWHGAHLRRAGVSNPVARRLGRFRGRYRHRMAGRLYRPC